MAERPDSRKGGSFGSVKSKHLLRALLQLGWHVKRETGGSHRVLAREGWPDYVFGFHDGEEIGPKMLSRVAKRTGLTPDDL
ncbi:MAG TPA: type II toxin-antitoxin system HicA family toxin [Rhodothermales bacterium]|nr:type II toxin-antitoxin system HicA family toxin [Rhodothermales bacterium]